MITPSKSALQLKEKTPSALQRWIDKTPDALQIWLDQWHGDKRERMDIGLNFFQKHFKGYKDNHILSELMCIDFAFPVRVISLPSGTELTGYKDPRISPFRGKYFTLSGTPANRLGLSSEGRISLFPKDDSRKSPPSTVRPKTLVRYLVNKTIPEVLESRCAATSDRWSDQEKQVLVRGGGIQYVIPRAFMHIIYTTPFPNQ